MEKKKKPSKKKTTGSSQPNQTEYWAKEDEYVLEATHPHRQLIIDELKKLEPFAGVLEVGCNIGQNLYLIQIQYPETQLAGVDINERAIEEAKIVLPSAILKVGDATALPFEDKSFDILIYDAVLMYVKDIHKALAEAQRVTRKAIIVLDWEAKKEILIGHSIARDYEKLWQDQGLWVEKIKITNETWPNEKWVKYGQLYVCHLPLLISTIN